MNIYANRATPDTGLAVTQWERSMTAAAVKQDVQEQDATAKLEAEVDYVVTAFNGDMRAALRELIIFGHFQTEQITLMREAVSHGFARGRF